MRFHCWRFTSVTGPVAGLVGDPREAAAAASAPVAGASEVRENVDTSRIEVNYDAAPIEEAEEETQVEDPTVEPAQLPSDPKDVD